jgi:peptidoglycan/xylan/chitin deacetylase (PgdA/CDA1 family)
MNNSCLFESGRTIFKNAAQAVKHWKNGLTDFRPKLLVLLYHRILPQVKDGPYRIAVRLETFKRQVSSLRERFPLITLSEALRQAKEEGPKAKLQIAITFDDGYLDVYDFAFPFLKEMRLGAAVFLSTDYIGKEIGQFLRSGPSADLNSRIMDWEKIRQLADCGFEIGSHGLTHAALTRLPLEEAKDEMRKSKEIIEAALQRPCWHFAFPFGSRRDFNPLLIDYARQIGFQSCMLNVHGYNHLEKDAFCFRRFIMEEGTDINYLLG